MNFEDLSGALSQALETGKIGTPVAFRLHWHLADRDADFLPALVRCVQLADQSFSDSPMSLMARQDPQGRQCSLLCKYPAGPTLLVTVVRGSLSRTGLHLLLVGNHGVIRLEGEDGIEGPATPSEADGERWRTLVDESLRRQAVIRIGDR